MKQDNNKISLKSYSAQLDAMRQANAKQREIEARMAAARKVKADKKAAADFGAMVEALGVITINSENKIIAARQAYTNMSEEAKQLQTVAGNKELKIDGSLSKLVKAENALKQVKDDIRLAHERAVSAADRKIYLEASKIKGIRTQAENLKTEALNGPYAECAKVIFTMLPHVGALNTKDDTIIAAAKKARNKVYNDIDTVAIYFHNECKELKQTLKRQIQWIVDKYVAKRGTATMEDIDKEISTKYSKYNLVYVIPAGAVFNIVKTAIGIKVTIYTLNKWFGLDKDDSWEVCIPESVPEICFDSIDTEEDFNESDFDMDKIFGLLDDSDSNSDSGEDK